MVTGVGDSDAGSQISLDVENSLATRRSLQALGP
jgi:hypothetical protein